MITLEKLKMANIVKREVFFEREESVRLQQKNENHIAMVLSSRRRADSYCCTTSQNRGLGETRTKSRGDSRGSASMEMSRMVRFRAK